MEDHTFDMQGLEALFVHHFSNVVAGGQRVLQNPHDTARNQRLTPRGKRRHQLLSCSLDGTI
jgi:hypothetical protein